MLDVECSIRGTAESYVSKVKVQHKQNPRLFEPRTLDCRSFGIQHFAGRVTYDASDFLGEPNIMHAKVNCAVCKAFVYSLSCYAFQTRIRTSYRMTWWRSSTNTRAISALPLTSLEASSKLCTPATRYPEVLVSAYRRPPTLTCEYTRHRDFGKMRASKRREKKFTLSSFSTRSKILPITRFAERKSSGQQLREINRAALFLSIAG